MNEPKEFIELEKGTTKYTRVFKEKEFVCNAPHRYKVCTVDTTKAIQELIEVKFQEGPIKEAGVNGVMNEDLINMVIDRLEHYQGSEFECEENAQAITHLSEALAALGLRTLRREERGVEGTYKV